MKKSDKKMVEEMLKHLKPLPTPEQAAEEYIARIYKKMNKKEMTKDHNAQISNLTTKGD